MSSSAGVPLAIINSKDNLNLGVQNTRSPSLKRQNGSISGQQRIVGMEAAERGMGDSFDYIDEGADTDTPLVSENATPLSRKSYRIRPRLPRSRSSNTGMVLGGDSSTCGGGEEGRNGLEMDKSLPSGPVSTLPSPSYSSLLTLNVAGRRFMTHAETLERYPNTILGNPAKRQHFYNPAANEYFFDRHRNSFDAIFYFYQSNGRMKRPESVPLDIFLKELRFYEMGAEILEKFWESEGFVKPPPIPLPDNRYLRMLWQVIEYPDTGFCARIFAFLSVSVIVISIVCFCLETIPSLREQFEVNRTLPNGTEIEHDPFEWYNPFFCIEFVCIIWFTIEFLLRFISCPSKMIFIKSFLNIIDLVAIIPFYINLFFSDGTPGGSSMSFAVLRVLRLVRVFRIFKLSRHSVGLQILGKTFIASIQELILLAFFMFIGLVLFASAVYFAEYGEDDTKFVSIPASFWYVIVTMTTVGYGDMHPTGVYGKLVGASCAIMGVLMLALPVPVIVGNFKFFYKQENKLAKRNRGEEEEEDNDCAASDSSSS